MFKTFYDKIPTYYYIFIYYVVVAVKAFVSTVRPAPAAAYCLGSSNCLAIKLTVKPFSSD